VAHRHERGRLGEHDDLLVVGAQPFDGLARRDREREQPMGCTDGSEPATDRSRSRAGRDTVVDDDHRRSTHVFRRHDGRERTDAHPNLFRHPFDFGRQPRVAHPHPARERIIDHGDAIGTHRADRELFVAGRTDLAGDDRSQRTREHTGDNGGDDDTATRDPANDGVVRDVAPSQLLPELASGIGPVTEQPVAGHGYAPRTERLEPREIGMAINAYVLIQTEVGKADNVAKSVRDIKGVISADDVTGPYDVIVHTEADSLDDLGKMVVSKIQAVEGITRTFTCPVVNL
jgi:Lrp/AsnC ligand binding domain